MSCVLTFLYVSTFAQVSIGFKGGYTFSDLKINNTADGKSPHSGGLTAWHGEMMLNIPLGVPHIYLQPDITYLRKGATFIGPKEMNSVAIGEGQKLVLDYVEIPVNFVYKVPVSFGQLAFGVGPYVAHGIYGRYGYTLNDGNKNTGYTKKVHFSDRYGSDDAAVNLRPWDFGLNGMINVEFNSCIVLGANYSLGLTDINRSYFGTVKNRYVGISVGFFFNREDY
ncbi:Outer membrane protein beta-barrel domain-containing protein [Chitinophaga costaii]|uniref:Outer membrane protein beta-barrel domain-containing protein n=2 Tax=Chitinophaga costaii TaxID=1335309 RepID=A0A1C4AAS8_9BACT|nr:porin family protein [Chitinophaga costaii]SCB91728.1 Outer membrane protein beta-barrel domain-containing protein [Chitinophaga costaii]